MHSIITAMVEAAKGGNTSAAKILIERCIPTLKPSSPHINIGGISNKTLTGQGRDAIEAMCLDRITPEQCETILNAISKLSRIIEIDDLEKRIYNLETAYDEH